ncbi:hypothetical protein Pd630_LPD16160 (plasmid) [Rhodococcus opacus PD630]|nr:hypothetical protein Pd630_LPD16160 [Rhodococcus opacus PD630]
MTAGRPSGCAYSTFLPLRRYRHSEDIDVEGEARPRWRCGQVSPHAGADQIWRLRM